MAGFASTRVLTIVFKIGEKGEWIPPAWFERLAKMVDETVGRKAKRSVVLFEQAWRFRGHCYYTLVLKWDAGKEEALDFSVREQLEQTGADLL